MRRKDRQMDEDFARQVIDLSQYGVMSFVYKNSPRARALSFVRDGDLLYFHSAKEGEKIRALEETEEVEIVFVSRVQVPDLYSNEEIGRLVEEGKASLLITKVFTTEFSSAMIKGRIRRVTEEKEMTRALKLVCEKYTPEKMDFVDKAIELSGGKVAVFAVEIFDLKAKRKKFDEKGEEIKWMSSNA